MASFKSKASFLEILIQKGQRKYLLMKLRCRLQLYVLLMYSCYHILWENIY